jgi:hypothetical protein
MQDSSIVEIDPEFLLEKLNILVGRLSQATEHILRINNCNIITIRLKVTIWIRLDDLTFYQALVAAEKLCEHFRL